MRDALRRLFEFAFLTTKLGAFVYGFALGIMACLFMVVGGMLGIRAAGEAIGICSL